MTTYIYRWTESFKPYEDIDEVRVNGPYEVSGDALSVYRVSVILDSKKHVKGEILTKDGVPYDFDTFGNDVCEAAGVKFPDTAKLDINKVVEAG